MPRKYREYSDDDVISAVRSVKSIAELLKKLGLKPAGGNYSNMKRILKRLDADTSHFTGQGWNKDEQLKDWSQYTQVSSIRPHLIRNRGHKCECCNLSNWMGEKIPIEVHHIDGNRCDNRLTNLKLLCANCHSQTDNFRNKSRK
tara:strand:- start:106 stop:537 length:432 start_codon:yes stop_codon:yes gene_type:complete